MPRHRRPRRTWRVLVVVLVACGGMITALPSSALADPSPQSDGCVTKAEFSKVRLGRWTHASGEVPEWDRNREGSTVSRVRRIFDTGGKRRSIWEEVYGGGLVHVVLTVEERAYRTCGGQGPVVIRFRESPGGARTAAETTVPDAWRIPSAPRNVTARAVDATSARVRLDPPSWRGGQTFLSYEAHCKSTNGGTGGRWVAEAEGPTSIVVGGLTPGATYRCRARAAAGGPKWGPFSAFTPAFTLPAT